MKSGNRLLIFRPDGAGSVKAQKAKATIVVLLLLPLTVGGMAFGGQIFVDANAVGADDGSSWENAFNHLQDAIGVCSSGDEILVAQGTYRPNEGSDVVSGRGATFHLVDNVTLSGGYAGYGEPPDARNVAVYETVLSGDLDDNDAGGIDVCNLLSDPSRSNNCYNVVTGTDCNDSTVVDGFTITGGNANGTRDRDRHGGGVHDGNLTISNCRILGNSAHNGGGIGCYGNGTVLDSIISGNCGRSGGGLYGVMTVLDCSISDNCATEFSGGGMSMISDGSTATDCTISGNLAFQKGGGAYVEQCAVILTRCTFAGNSSGTDGGGVYIDSGTIGEGSQLQQCRIVGNTAGGDGGGVHNASLSQSRLSSCSFSGNIAGDDGGGMCESLSGGSSLVNCTFAHNDATSDGGGICYDSVPVTGRVVTNCILWYNSDSLGATSEDSQIHIKSGPTVIPLRYCSIQGWTGGMGGTSHIGVIGDDPVFVDADGVDNTAGTEDDNLRLQAESKCIDSGDNSVVEDGATDLDGKARIIRGVVDIGAYEAQAGGPHVPPRYEIADLGTLEGTVEGSRSSAFGINEFGQAVGWSETSGGEVHAFLWDDEVGMIDLGTLGGSTSYAYAINNAGQVAGSALTETGELHAFLWEDGEMIDLGLLSGGNCTEAAAINDVGQVVGMARTSVSIYSWQRAFLWENGVMADLDVLDGASISYAADINIRGQVVGTSGDRAFLWDGTAGMTELTDLPTSQGNAINDAGVVVLGSSEKYYIRDGTGGLYNMNLPARSRTNAINNSGRVVGDFDYSDQFHFHAFLWDGSYGMIDLNDLIVAGSGWKELSSAGDINNNGQIVGYGYPIGSDPSQLHAFVMSPIPAEAYLVAHWELDESSGGTAEDSVGDNDGALQGDPQWKPCSGRMNGALGFDGLNDYVDCGNRAVFDITDEITVAAWVNIGAVHVDWQTIVAKGDSAWRLSTAEDEMRFHFAVTGGPPWNFINGDIVVDADEWHHVCGTYDGTNMRLYVDGVEDFAGPVADSNGIEVNTENVYIGENSEQPGRHWDGMIDDVRIYSCPLTTVEVYDLFMEAPLYVDGDSPPGWNDGSSWKQAFHNLQDALASPSSGNRIHVAAGVYTPDSGAEVVPGNRLETFQLIDGVSVKGGYAGFGEPSPKVRDFTAYESILSGDLAGDDDGFANNTENSYHVVTGSGTNREAVLDGFTISGGNADEVVGADRVGGGMLNVRGSPTVIDCVLSVNMAGHGGGMYNEFASPIIINVRFVDNLAFLDNAADDPGGGGMYNYQSSPRLENCLFANNSVDASTGDGGDGGGIFCGQSSPTLVNCVIRANSAGRSGGGMTSRWGGSPSLVNCLFNANVAGDKGGGLNVLDEDTVKLTNCTFSQNLATSGGGIYSYYAEPVLVNCILYGNTGGGNLEKAQIWIVGESFAIDYSCVEGWSGSLGGAGNIGAEPYFADANGPDNIAGTEDDNLRLGGGSLCIDGGDNGALSPLVITDLDGNPRVIRGVVDMGAYEFAGMLSWYVDVVNGNDNNNGLSRDTAFATIQKGINTATEGYSVIVYPGVYREEIFFNGKAVTVTGEGSDAVILEAPAGYAVTFQHGEDANSVLKNVVIRNCKHAGILVRWASPKITNVTVVDNGEYGLVRIDSGRPDISNSIFWNNTISDIAGCDDDCQVRYCCIEQGGGGKDIISSNPKFADLAGGDYHLLSQRGRHRPTTNEWILDDITSPCVDGGEPWVNPSGERMPNGGRLNMGAFGGTYYASMSEWPLAGDINRDGVINMEDFALVAESWLSALEWAK